MSAKVTGHYQGRKKVELLHVDSGSKLITDAAREYSGDGSKFSPIDLVAAAFGSCVITTIAVVAERGGISVEGMRMAVEKQMIKPFAGSQVRKNRCGSKIISYGVSSYGYDLRVGTVFKIFTIAGSDHKSAFGISFNFHSRAFDVSAGLCAVVGVFAGKPKTSR